MSDIVNTARPQGGGDLRYDVSYWPTTAKSSLLYLSTAPSSHVVPPLLAMSQPPHPSVVVSLLSTNSFGILSVPELTERRLMDQGIIVASCRSIIIAINGCCSGSSHFIIIFTITEHFMIRRQIIAERSIVQSNNTIRGCGRQNTRSIW